MTKREEIQLRAAMHRAPKPQEMREEEQQARAESAVREAEAQLAITKALAALPSHESRERVFRIVRHLLEADLEMPGVLDALMRGWKGGER